MKVRFWSVDSYRPEEKNQSLSLEIGPPKVASVDLPSRSGFVMPAAFWRGVSSIHFGLLKFSRKLPPNVLPPLFVMTLTTPPEKRPYSAEMPPVRMFVCWMASSMNRLFAVPNRLSLMSTPFIMKTLSNDVAPAMASWPTFDVLLFRPGARSAIWLGLRPTGSGSSSAFVYAWLNVGTVSAAGFGDSASTVTVSVMPDNAIVWPTSMVLP